MSKRSSMRSRLDLLARSYRKLPPKRREALVVKLNREVPGLGDIVVNRAWLGSRQPVLGTSDEPFVVEDWERYEAARRLRRRRTKTRSSR